MIGTEKNEKPKHFKLMIVPGNGCDDIKDGNWYYWLAKQLRKSFPQHEIICETMPDPYEAKEKYWIPFIKKHLTDDDGSLLYIVGHSSGSVAIMRLLESFKERISPHIAKEIFAETSDYDFSNYQMDADESLIALGIAKKGINPEHPEDGEIIIYG